MVLGYPYRREDSGHDRCGAVEGCFRANVWFPTILRSDNASEFLAPVVKYVNQRLEITHITGAAYHPEAQGATDRLNRKITNML